MPPNLKACTADSEFKLIHEVRNRPISWDVTAKEYRRNDLKEVHWQEVAKSLGPEFTSDLVKKRFSNMKDTFMDNHRKVRESKQRCSGKSPGEVYTPKWSMYLYLEFLLKTVSQADSFSNVNVSPDSPCEPSPQSEAAETQIIQVYFDENRQSFMIIPQATGNELSCLEESLLSDSLSKSSSSPAVMSPPPVQFPRTSPVQFSLTSRPLDARSMRPASAPVQGCPQVRVYSAPDQSMYEKRGVKRVRGSVTEEALNIMKQVASQPISVPQGDSAEYFGGYVAVKLREMDPTKRKTCEEKIMRALLD